MTTTHFKDIYNYLSEKYPNSKVYIISDHHFYHENIINYSRKNFKDINEMNNTIINKHNKTVNNDDIIIFLGDFSFKNNQIINITKKLNGHKFLLLGNHDDPQIIKKYQELGFDNIFLTPLKFNDYYLSHYPILDSKTNTILYSILKKEMIKEDGINLYGHDHEHLTKYKNSLNITCEALNYTPLFIGYTKSYNNKNKTIINSKYLKDILNYLEQEIYISKKLLLDDYFYTMAIEYLNKNYNNIVINGSFSLYKKLGYISNFSDLDITLLSNPTLKKKPNKKILSNITTDLFCLFNEYMDFNLDYIKRMPNIKILHLLYKNNGITNNSIFDINLVPKEIYKDSDFTLIKTDTILEKMVNKYNLLNEEYTFPKLNTIALNEIGDITNLILQYFYQLGFDDKKPQILKKIDYITKHLTNKEELNNIEDYLIRFFLRNIIFFKSIKRTNDIDYLKNNKFNYNDIKKMPNSIREYLDHIFNNPNSSFNLAFNLLTNENYNLEEVKKEILNTRKRN